jgi:preprotein translocase subunit SecG
VTALVLTLHILACVVLIVMVLLQSGKEGMGVIFGGGSQSFFGSSGAGSLLAKVTAGCAALFLVTSLSYNLLLKQGLRDSGSIMQDMPAPEPEKPAVLFEDPAPAEEASEQAPEQ